MPLESWITPEETPTLAAAATAMIDAALSTRTQAVRDAFWSSVRKCYNTPYNTRATGEAEGSRGEAAVTTVPEPPLPAAAWPIEILEARGTRLVEIAPSA